MRILFVTPYPPSPIRVRSFGFARHLARHHDVTVVTPATNERERADAESLRRAGLHVRVVADRSIQQAMRAVRALGSTLPLQVAYGAAPALRAVINHEMSTGGYDVVHIEHVRAVGALPAQRALPIIWDAVDCVSHLFEQRDVAGGASLLRPIMRLEARRTRMFEWEQVCALRHIVVTCERDRQLLLQTGPATDVRDAPTSVATVNAIANGVEQKPSLDDPPRQPATLVFSGKMSYHANIAGVKLLMSEILPRIWAHRPDVRLVIAGSKPPAAVRRLARDPRILVTGYVPDLKPYIAQARVAISPLPYAVGVQNKVLEAMALGTPVVATSIAASGLRVVDGRDLLVADEPEEFAASTLRLLGDDALWRDLATNGQAYVKRYHTWDDVTAQLAIVYEQAAEAWKYAHGHAILA